MAKIRKTIKTPRGFAWKDSNTNLQKGETTIIFKARSKLGKFLKRTKKVVVKHPKNSRLDLIENNRPKIGIILFEFKVKK